ncbi:hypothetical protein [Okeania sp. KiyG1]|uniref:hypothetical protein n=1 Tax=Okeania sp. KiyG1 TaxID=2720165 RepID=UPI0019212A1A|nr:hypothetical protein [Okeania sp. KiyG1]
MNSCSPQNWQGLFIVTREKLMGGWGDREMGGWGDGRWRYLYICTIKCTSAQLNVLLMNILATTMN